uniref:Serine/threonine-protein kinase RIO3 n=1 Tax=Rhabditophanes sp. KR3021 TaxID=114890 RepID=A0AC35TIR0_9BILA
MDTPVDGDVIPGPVSPTLKSTYLPSPWSKPASSTALKLTEIMTEEVIFKISDPGQSTPHPPTTTPTSLPDDMDPDIRLAIELQKQFDAELSIDDTDHQEALRLQKLFDEEVIQTYDNHNSQDYNEAKKLQHEWDHEVMLEGKEDIRFGVARYKYSHDDERLDNLDVTDLDNEDDDAEKKLEQIYSNKAHLLRDGGESKKSDGSTPTKHDIELTKIRNADKTMNFAIGMNVGDSSDLKINNKIYNKLKQYSKDEIKRSIKVKDKSEKATYEQGLDEDTRLIIFKQIQKEELDLVEGIIASGKESIVLHGRKADDHFAIKVYKKTLSEFKNRGDYVKDDFRFKNPRNVLEIWSEKEYLNLKRLNKEGINAPQPIFHAKNVMIMRMVGGDSPALKLKNLTFEDEDSKQDIFQDVKQILIDMYKKCKLVHGDLSEFNLLYDEGKVYVIDVSQSMDLSHPRALNYLVRDIQNVLSFFTNIGTTNLPRASELFVQITDLEIDHLKDLNVQVEQFAAINRNVNLKNDKHKPSDFEIRAMKEDDNYYGPI